MTSSMLGHDPIAPVLIWVALIFSFAIIGRYIANRLNQPGVLGELLIGVVFGNICYFGNHSFIVVLREGASIFNIMGSMLQGSPLSEAVNLNIPNKFYAAQMLSALTSSHGIDYLKAAYALDMFARLGVIFLLFMVGLETSVAELKHTGRQSLQVAIIGVIAPIILGLFTVFLLIPKVSYQSAFFIAATLAATSIGISARVFKEMQKLRTPEVRTILGAAMLDDIFGLILLAIASSIVMKGEVQFLMIGQVVLLTIVFFSGVIFLSPWILRLFGRYGYRMDDWETKLFISFVFVMILAYLATLVQLASIIGAFAAGMIINDSFFDNRVIKNKLINAKPALSIKDLMAPLEFLFAPLFFMLVGIQVKLETFFNVHVIVMAMGFLLAAIFGKLLSGLGGYKKDDRLLIGIGMLPRGEVGLVFASIGRTLGVMSDEIFSAIVLMVIVTTFMVAPLLKWRYKFSSINAN